MCEREAYQFVADVVWEMTLFGDDRATAEERRAEIACDLGRQVAETREALSYGRLDGVVVFEPSAEDGVPTAPEGEHDFADRMYDIGDTLAKALRRDFHRDCVDLAERLGRS